MLKLKLQYFGHLMQRADSLAKTLMLGTIEGKRRRGRQMVGWHHQLNGHEFEHTLGDGEGRESLAHCSSWGRKELDMTKRIELNCGCWRKLLSVPWAAGRSNKSNLKEISPVYSMEGLMLKLKLQYLGHLMQRADSLEKTLMLGGQDGRQEEKWMTNDEMVGWHHLLDGHEFEQAPGVGDGQGNLACCSPWGHKESDTTEFLN